MVWVRTTCVLRRRHVIGPRSTVSVLTLAHCDTRLKEKNREAQKKYRERQKSMAAAKDGKMSELLDQIATLRMEKARDIPAYALRAMASSDLACCIGPVCVIQLFKAHNILAAIGYEGFALARYSHPWAV